MVAKLEVREEVGATACTQTWHGPRMGLDPSHVTSVEGWVTMRIGAHWGEGRGRPRGQRGRRSRQERLEQSELPRELGGRVGRWQNMGWGHHVKF